MDNKKTKCPICHEGTLEHRHIPQIDDVDMNSLARPNIQGHDAYVCTECPFVGFEYYNHYDIKALGQLIK
jgi:hypothetical protein